MPLDDQRGADLVARWKRFTPVERRRAIAALRLAPSSKRVKAAGVTPNVFAAECAAQILERLSEGG